MRRFGRLPPWLKALDDAWRMPTRRAMVLLARHWRRRHRGTVFIGVTGSCGKTTTKEMIHAILSTRLQGLKTPQSYNGFRTVFLRVLATRRRHRYSIVEVGATRPGFIDQLLALCEPDIGVVLNVGTDHYTAFRGREGVAKEKGRLVEALPATGVAILNYDDPYVRDMAARTKARVVFIGRSPEAEVRAEQVRYTGSAGLCFTAVAGDERAEVQLAFPSEYFVYNALAALAVGRILGLGLADGAKALRRVKPHEGRLQAVETPGGVVFLADYWKASMNSFPPAFDALRHTQARRRFAVIGTISDYPGSASPRYRDIARKLLEVAETVVFVGPNAALALKAAKDFPGRVLVAFRTVREANDFLSENLQPGDVVLVKASGLADHLERVMLHRDRPIACWRERCGRRTPCVECKLLYNGVAASASEAAGAPANSGRG